MLFTIIGISVIIGIALLVFVMQWINEGTSDNQTRWEKMNCIQLLLFKESQEYDMLDEPDLSEFQEALEPCLGNNMKK